MVDGLAREGPESHHALRDETRPADASRRSCHLKKETLMQWTTPTACDFRFGFEITMYVAAR